MKEVHIPLKRDNQFLMELRRYLAAGRVIDWYTTDYHYVIRLRRMV